MDLAEFLNGGDGTSRFGQREQARGERVEARGEAGGFRVDEALSDGAALLVAMCDEGGHAAIDLVREPDIQIVEPGEDGSLSIGTTAFRARPLREPQPLDRQGQAARLRLEGWKASSSVRCRPRASQRRSLDRGGGPASP